MSHRCSDAASTYDFKKLLQYQQETKNDEAFKVVIDYVRNGWPASKKDISSAALTYYSIRDQITIVNELVFKYDRLIVPSTLQKGAIQRIHNGHQGTDKCLVRARDSVYWPGIINQITLITSSCSHCLDYRNRQTAESPVPHEIPVVPWTKVGTDVLHIRGRRFVIVID